MPLDPQALADLVVQTVQATLRPYAERLAALEARPLSRDGRDGLPGVPGPAGLPGEPGTAGAPGRDGADGQAGTLDNLTAVYDGDRTLTLCFKSGEAIPGGVLELPLVIDRGVYRPETTYRKGDAVTYAGSLHIAQMTTSAKPEDGGAWRLAVKRGRDGKDARS
jgi:hypothetical protein